MHAYHYQTLKSALSPSLADLILCVQCWTV